MIRLKRTSFLKTGFGILSLIILSFAACKKKDTDDLIDGKEPIALDCNYFNEDRVLENDPERPIDYIISCIMDIKGKKIEIEPGTVIAFSENGGIKLWSDSEGFLKAKGTSSDPITFKGTVNEKGFWENIDIGSDNSNNEFKYVNIQGAGRGSKSALVVNLNAHLTLENSEIYNNSGTGLAVYTATPFSGVDDGVYSVVVENNKIYDNQRAVSVHVQNVGSLSSSNDFSGNEIDEIYVDNGTSSGYSITQDVTWQAHDQPYMLVGGNLSLYAKLTLKPGTTLKFDLDRNLMLHDRSGGHGQIYAVGTEERPITFTSIEDIPKYWKGIISYSEHPGNEIGYAVIENTGNENTGNRWTQGNVTIVSPASPLNIHNVTFINMNPRFCAVRGSATVNNITVIGHEEDQHCVHKPSHGRGGEGNNYDFP